MGGGRSRQLLRVANFTPQELNVERIDWERVHERFGKSIVNLDVRLSRVVGPQLSVELVDLGPVQLSWHSSRGVSMSRELRHVMDGVKDLTLTLPLSGSFTALQGGASRTVRPGEAVVLRADIASTLEMVGHSEFIGVKVEEAVWRERLSASQLGGGPLMIDALSPAMKLLQGYLFSLRAGGAGMDEALLGVVARHIADLVETAIGQAAPDGIDLARRIDPEVILESARALMRQHHDDATMTIEDVSGWLTMPPQALSAAFEAAGSTFERELSTLRLGFVGRDLRDPQLAGSSVAEVALLHGLDDDKDFHRLFEAVFGLDPAEYRRARSS